MASLTEGRSEMWRREGHIDGFSVRERVDEREREREREREDQDTDRFDFA